MRPSTFVEWRQVYHRERLILGDLVAMSFDGRRIRMTRDLWKQIQRHRRVHARMEVESEVKDVTWCMELLKLLKANKP